jgi:hypothetical protein
MRQAIGKLEALILEAKQLGFITMARKLQDIVDDLTAEQDGLDMDPQVERRSRD